MERSKNVSQIKFGKELALESIYLHQDQWPSQLGYANLQVHPIYVLIIAARLTSSTRTYS